MIIDIVKCLHDKILEVILDQSISYLEYIQVFLNGLMRW